jgi:hypothetical protein
VAGSSFRGRDPPRKLAYDDFPPVFRGRSVWVSLLTVDCLEFVLSTVHSLPSTLLNHPFRMSDQLLRSSAPETAGASSDKRPQETPVIPGSMSSTPDLGDQDSVSTDSSRPVLFAQERFKGETVRTVLKELQKVQRRLFFLK